MAILLNLIGKFINKNAIYSDFCHFLIVLWGFARYLGNYSFSEYIRTSYFCSFGYPLERVPGNKFFRRPSDPIWPGATLLLVGLWQVDCRRSGRKWFRGTIIYLQKSFVKGIEPKVLLSPWIPVMYPLPFETIPQPPTTIPHHPKIKF